MRLDRFEAGAIALTAAYNVAVNRRLPRPSHVPANLAASGTLLLVARRAGVDTVALGLAPTDARGGLRAGAAWATAASAIVACGAAVPVTRPFFVDGRVSEHSTGELAYHVLVRIPLATALGEELVFRSALLGMFGRTRSRAAAIALTSALFGLWHVLPALASADQHGPASRIRRGAVVGGVVAATAAGGAAFAALRFRSRSVLAPALTHAAVNIAGLLAARAITRRVDGGSATVRRRVPSVVVAPTCR